MVNFSHITGPYFNALAVSVHAPLRPYRVRYDGTIFTPFLLVTDRGPQSTSDVSFELSSSENLHTYEVSLPEATAQQVAAAALLPDAIWEVSKDQGATWEAVRVFGEPKFHPGGQRYTVILVRGGIGENLGALL